jgi:prepilin-type N-terminal cleavage/methylation domain-containing protein
LSGTDRGARLAQTSDVSRSQHRRSPFASREHGFTLIEAITAIVLVGIAATGVAQLLTMASRAAAATGASAVLQQIAREKMEQIRALAWTADGVVPVSDWSSDLTITPTSSSGGSGLGASPPGTLAGNVGGYCDFLDATGHWMAGGDHAPGGAAWVRRWSIEPMAGLADTLFLQVVVVSAHAASDRAGVVGGRSLDGARLLSIRTRTSR